MASHYLPAVASQDVVAISFEAQVEAMDAAKLKCIQRMQDAWNTTGGQCHATWDGIMCWPATPPGTLAERPCPDYINRFNMRGNATRQCLDTGQWFHHPVKNNTWTNLTNCKVTSVIESNTPAFIVPEEHLERIKLMYSIGYGVSLLALAIAIFIMVYFRRLHCPRNTIHLHLFAAFALRAVLSFLKDSLLVNHVGLPGDVIEVSSGQVIFNPSGTHWQCKLLFTTFHYVQLTSSAWVFMEGLYLHILVTITIFSERRYIRWCTIFGWGGPLLFLVPWVSIRATTEDVYCWNTHPTQAYFWILKGPQVAIVIVNFIFFVNITRILFTKLIRCAPTRARRYRYRRLGKSTLVLIPIFGVHYLLTIAVPDDLSSVTETIKLYLQMFFNSFQGLLIAFLFCFLNGEVQSEVRKRYIRHKLRVNSRQFHNKYVATSTTGVRAPPRPNGSLRHESRELNSSSGSAEHNGILKQTKKPPSYIQPLRYYRSHSPNGVAVDTKLILCQNRNNSYV